MARLRTWFLRNILEAVERKHGVDGIQTLRERLSPRLAMHASLDRSRTSPVVDSIPLDEAEEILLTLDTALGDGSGRVIEAIGRDLATRNLTQGSAGVVVGDLLATVARMQAFLEHPFIDAELAFELERTTAGFELTIGILGNPRATKVMRHFATGCILAAERFARESTEGDLKILADNIVDRAHISAHYQRSIAPPPPDDSPTMRRIPSIRPLTSLSAEVDRILSTLPPRRTDSSPPPPPVAEREDDVEVRGADTPRS